MNINQINAEKAFVSESFWKCIKRLAHKSLIVFLCLWHAVYTMPAGAMEALIDESVTLLSSQSIKSIQPDLSIASVSRNKEGSYAIALHPDLWASQSQKVVLIDGDVPVAQISMEKGVLHFLADEASFILEGRAYPQNNYGALTVATNGLLTVKGGEFSKETTLQALKLRLEEEVISQLPLRAWGQESLYIEGAVRGYSDISLKSNELKNAARVFAHSLHLDILKGTNEKNGDLGAEQDIVISQSESHENDRGFKSFLNEGSMRAKRSVSLKGDQFEGNETSRIFAGVLHSFKGDQYNNNGKLFTPNLSLIQSRQAKLGTNFHFEGSSLFALTDELLDIHGSRAKSAEIFATTQVYLQSNSFLKHQGTTILRDDIGTKLPYEQYFEMSFGKNVPQTTKEEARKTLNRLPQEIEVYRKKMSLSQFQKGVGVYLGANMELNQSGTIKSFTGEMEMKGNNVLLSGNHYLTNHFKENKLVVQGINAAVNGIFEGAFSSIFKAQEHLGLHPEHLKTDRLFASSRDMTLGGAVDVRTFFAEVSSTLRQDKSSHVKAQLASFVAGESEDLYGKNDIQKQFILNAPTLTHAAQTTTEQLNMHGGNVVEAGESNVKTLAVSANESFTQTESAKTVASEQVQAESKKVRTEGDITAPLLNVHAKESLETAGNINNSVGTILQSDKKATIGGNVRTVLLDTKAKELEFTGQTKTHVTRAKGEDSLKITGEHHAEQAQLSSNYIEQGGKFTGGFINAEATNQYAHTGYTQVDTMSVKAPTAKFDGVFDQTTTLTVQAQKMITDWVADIQNLTFTGDHLKIGGDSRIKQASLLVQDLLHFSGSLQIDKLSAQTKSLIAEGILKGKQAHLQIDERASFNGAIDYEDALKLSAQELILHAAHLKASLMGLKAKSMIATHSSLTSDVTSVDVSGGKADLKGLRVDSKDLFSLKADQASVSPELITTALAKFYLQTYEDGINGIMKLAHQLVHCDKVCFDARKETLVVDQPTKWRKNIALSLAKVVLKESVTSEGSIELISETGIEVLKSVIAESIYLQAKTEDIVLDHALLKAIQEIGIKVDEGSVKASATRIETQKGDIGIEAGLDIELESKSHREGDSENYKDVKDKMQANAGGALNLNAGRDIKLISVEINSEKGTNFKAGRHIIDAPLALKTKTVEWNKGGFERSETIFQDVSKHITNGNFESVAEGTQQLFAPEVKASQISISGKEGVAVHEVHDIEEYESKSKKKGDFGKKKIKEEQSFEATSKGAKLVGTEPAKISSENGDISLTNITSKAPKLILDAVEGMVEILLGTNHASSSVMKSNSNFAWQKFVTLVQEHKTSTASSIEGGLEIHSKETFLESVNGQTLEFLELIEQHGGEITNITVEEFHKVTRKSSQGPSTALALIAAVAISICTAGAGSVLGGMVATSCGLATTGGALTAAGSIVSSMTAAGFCSLCSQLGVATLCNIDDPLEGLKSLGNKKVLKSLAISMVTAGVTAGLGEAFGIQTDSVKLAEISKNDTFAGIAGHMQKNLLECTVNEGVSAAFGGESPKDAVLNVLRGVASGVIGAIGANKIGAAYGAKEIDSLSHKLFHGLLGAARGTIESDNLLKGATAGALGAMVAEVFAETLIDPKEIRNELITEALQDGHVLTEDSFRDAFKSKLRPYTNCARLASGTIALLLGQDTSTAMSAATNAVENNFVPALVLGIEFSPAIIAALEAALGLTIGICTGAAISHELNKSSDKMDAAPKDAQWADEGLNVHEDELKVLITPAHNQEAMDQGFEAWDNNVDFTREGFQRADDVPDSSMLYKKQTEPQLPPKTIANERGVEIKHYTRSGDHGPAHLHIKGGGTEVRIGQNGKPLKGVKELSPLQRDVVEANIKTIRKAVGQIQKWHKHQNQTGEKK